MCTLECLRKCTSNHVSKFQANIRKIGFRNQVFCVAHRDILTLYWHLALAISRDRKKNGRCQTVSIVSYYLKGFQRRILASSVTRLFRTFNFYRDFITRNLRGWRDLPDIEFLDKNKSDSVIINVCGCAIGLSTHLLILELLRSQSGVKTPIK